MNKKPNSKITQEKKQLILDAYAEVIVEKGMEKASFSNVAEKAGIPQSLIFYYFKNKKDMFIQLMDHIIFICCETYFPEQKFIDDDVEFVEFSRRAIKVHQYREQNTPISARIYYNMVFQSVINPIIKEKCHIATNMLLKCYVTRFDYYNKKGIIHIKSPMDTARLLECTINGLGNTWILYSSEEYNYWAEIIIDSFMTAINYTGAVHKFLAYQNDPYPYNK